MFESLFKKAAGKTVSKIDKTAEDIGNVVTDAKNLLDNGKDSVKLIVTLSVIGITLGIVADVISIAVGIQTIRLLKLGK